MSVNKIIFYSTISTLPWPVSHFCDLHFHLVSFKFLLSSLSFWTLILPYLAVSSVQSLSHVWLFVTAWTAARQTSLSITNSWSLPKPISIESVMPSNHLILCHPLLLLPSIFPSIRVFSNESALRIRWPKYWSFSFNISPSNEPPGLFALSDLFDTSENPLVDGTQCCDITP